MTEKRDESRDIWTTRDITEPLGPGFIWRLVKWELSTCSTYTADKLDLEQMVPASDLESVTRERDAAVRRVAEALDVIEKFGGIDGDHHKTWVIDQAIRALTGDGYAQWVKEQCDGEDGPNTYDWDEGIPP